MTRQTLTWQNQVSEHDIATALHAVRLSRPRLSDAVAVVGDGALALATVVVLLARGVGNVALVANDGEWARGAASAGATVFPPPASATALDQVRAQLGGYGPDFVFMCERKSDAHRLAIEIARPAGMVIFMTIDAEATSMNPNLLVFGDKRVRGSGRPNDEDFRIARDLIEGGQLHRAILKPDKAGS